MKSATNPWSLAACLAAALILLALNVNSGNMHSGDRPAAPPTRNAAANSPAEGHLVTASLSAALDPAAAMPAGEARPPAGHAADLPPVEEFILTPPDLAAKRYETTLSLRFSSRAADGLASTLPTTLGDRRVLLHRSADDPAIYSAAIDFDWAAFAREQQQRQQLAANGEMVPVFDGHRLASVEHMQFIDPQQIQQALQSHRPLHFTSRVLQDSPGNILADHELMITSVSVVEDPARTWDPCSLAGKPMSAWTFGALMAAIANDDPATHLVADQMVQNWLNQWTIQQNVNHFPVSARLGMIGLLRRWRQYALDKNGNVDVSQAPFQLNAIVNRIDLASAANPAGELRFVFGYAPCQGGEGSPTTFNLILEYRVPVAQCSWAQQWHKLAQQLGPKFNSALQAITDQVVTSGASQHLNDLRTNEAFTTLSGVWEQRHFVLTAGALKEAPVAQTPNGDTAPGRIDFNQQSCNPGNNCQAAVLTNYINTFQQDILNNNYTVPLSFPGSSPFLGGSSLNGPFDQKRHQLVYWQGNPAPSSNQARSIFSGNTCNGCHGRETFVEFQQVENRQPGPPGTVKPAALSAFLTGCSTSSAGNPLTDQTGPCPEPPTNTCNLQTTLTQNPPCISYVQDPGDPSGHTVNQFAELSRRAQSLSTVLSGCSADDMLQSLATPRLSSAH